MSNIENKTETTPDTSILTLPQQTLPISESLDEYVKELFVISQIVVDNKLTIVDNKLAIEMPGILSAFIRKYNGDSRKITYDFVNKTVNTVLTFIQLMSESKYLSVDMKFNDDVDKLKKQEYDTHRTAMLEKIGLCIWALWKSTSGLANLLKTYASDENMVKLITDLIIKIKNNVKTITNVLYQDFKNFILYCENDLNVYAFDFLKQLN